MERQQQIAYQLDLFMEQKWNAIGHFQKSGGVSEGSEEAVLQVTEAGKQERALTDDLMLGLFCLALNYDKLNN